MPPVKNLTAAKRRRAAAERADYLDRKTDGGAEVWDFFLNLARDPTADIKDRIRANEWITEHGGAGKPASNVEVNVTDEREPEVDLSALSLDEVRDLERLLTKAVDAKRLPAAPDTEADIVPEEQP